MESCMRKNLATIREYRKASQIREATIQYIPFYVVLPAVITGTSVQLQRVKKNYWKLNITNFKKETAEDLTNGTEELHSRLDSIEKLRVGLNIIDPEKELIECIESYGLTNIKKETVVDLTNRTEELHSRLDSLGKKVEQNRINQEKELKECKESYARNKINQENEMKELKDSLTTLKELKDSLTTLKELKDSLTTLKEHETNYCWFYIREVCLNLQANMFHYVLPDQFAVDWLYKVKDIEEDIYNEKLLDDDERREALERWESLKEKLCWEPSLESTLKMLQKERSPMYLPTGLTVEEAERVAEVLDQQGRLKGRTSYEKVKKIIEMWKISTSLV